MGEITIHLGIDVLVSWLPNAFERSDLALLFQGLWLVLYKLIARAARPLGPAEPHAFVEERIKFAMSAGLTWSRRVIDVPGMSEGAGGTYQAQVRAAERTPADPDLGMLAVFPAVDQDHVNAGDDQAVH